MVATWSSYAVLPNCKPSQIENYDSIESAIQDTMQLWHEEESAFRLIYIVNEESCAVNAIVASGETPTIVHVTRVGDTIGQRHEIYRVVYHLDKDGCYLSTEITKLN